LSALYSNFHSQEYKFLENWLHPVKIKDMLKYHIAQGELNYIKKGRPVKFWKGLFYDIKSYRKRKKLYIQTLFVKNNYKAPSDISYPKPGVSNNLDIEKIPFFTFIDEIIFLFASNYGWSLKDIMNLPYSVVNDQRLVIGYHEALKYNKLTVTSNPSKEGSREISSHPVRPGMTNDDVMEIYFEMNRREYMGHFEGGK